MKKPAKKVVAKKALPKKIPAKKAPIKKPVKKPSPPTKKRMEDKSKEKISYPIKGKSKKILTAEGWKRLMMGKDKKQK